MRDVPSQLPACLITGLASLLMATTVAAEAPRAIPISVEADSFVVIMAEEKAVWRGDVQATQGNYTFRTGQLTIYLEQIQSQSAVDSPETNENHATTRHGYELSATNLTYDIGDNEIVATGNSELRRAEEVIRADRITYAVTEGIATALPRRDGRVFVQFFSKPGQLPFPAASVHLPEAIAAAPANTAL